MISEAFLRLCSRKIFSALQRNTWHLKIFFMHILASVENQVRNVAENDLFQV